MGDRAPRVLVLGFGAFLDVIDNPAARLSEAVDGKWAGGLRVVGRELPVSYGRCLQETERLVQQHAPVAVLCVGVARGRLEAAVEFLGKNLAEGTDVDGECPGILVPGGPETLAASAASHALASALAVAESHDAGQYVCNAWLYCAQWRSQRVAPGGHPLPVSFLHIPDKGFDPARLLLGLQRGWGTLRVPGTLS